MKTVWVVQHSYELDGNDEVKFIGVFSTLENAKKIVEKLKKKKGFKSYSKGFHIDKMALDQVFWLEGFETI